MSLQTENPSAIPLAARQALAATIGAPAPYLGQVGTRCFVPNSDAGNAITYGMAQSAHYLRDKVTGSITLEFPSYRLTAAAETDRGTAGTIKASLQMPDGSWLLSDQNIANANNPVAHPPGNIALTWTLSTSLPEGFLLRVRSYIFNSAGIYWCAVGGGNVYANHPLDFMDLGTTPNDKTTNGASIGAPGGIGYFPVAIAGKTTKPSVMIVGTSRETGGCAWNGDYLTDIGPTARVIGKRYGFSNFSQAGSLLAQWNAGSHTYWNALLAKGYFSHLTNEYCINDVPSDALATTTAARRALFATNAKAAAPGVIIIGHTLYHYVTSTDVFTTKAGQAQGSNNPRVLAFNGLVRAGIAGEDFVWDVFDGVDPMRTGLMPVTPDPFAPAYTPCIFTGSISGTTLTVSAITSGTLYAGDAITDTSDTGGGTIVYNTAILRQLTGTTGGVGTYLINMPYGGAYPQKANVTSRALTTGGRMSRDGLHLQWWGEDLIARNKGADLLGFLKR